MTVLMEDGYTLPSGDQPLSHARIAHRGNWLSGGTVTVSSTAVDYFAAGPNNTMTFERWKPTDLPASWQYSAAAPVECDYCAIAAHTIGTNGGRIRVQYSTDDGLNWVSVISQTFITSNEPIFCIFAPVTAKDWRVLFTNDGTPAEVGVIKFGTALQMERPIAFNHAPGRYQRDTKITESTSETGEFLGQTVRRSALDASYDWRHLTRAWVDANWLPFMLAAERDPFFIAWRPDKYGDCLYGRATGSPEASFMGLLAYMQASVTVRGHAYE